MKKYYIYILLCKNDKLYTGITTDVKRRFLEHLGIKKNGAKWTKINPPKKLMLCYETDNRSNALKLEYLIKQLTREEKFYLIDSNIYFKMYFENKINISLFKRKRLKINA